MSYRNQRRRIRKLEQWTDPKDEGGILYEDLVFTIFLTDPEAYREQYERCEINFPPQPLERRAAELLKSGRSTYVLRGLAGRTTSLPITAAHLGPTPEKQIRYRISGPK